MRAKLERLFSNFFDLDFLIESVIFGLGFIILTAIIISWFIHFINIGQYLSAIATATLSILFAALAIHRSLLSWVILAAGATACGVTVFDGGWQGLFP